jgi:hypothetical protein
VGGKLIRERGVGLGGRGKGGGGGVRNKVNRIRKRITGITRGNERRKENQSKEDKIKERK